MAITGGQPVGASTPVAGIYTSAAPSLADGNHQTLTVSSDGSLRVAITTGASAVAAGDVAHDAADSGSPVKVGGKGSAAVAAAVTEGDRVNASFTLEGRQRTTSEGTVAHDGVDAGNPLKIGGKANAAAPAAVGTESDRVDASFTLEGRLRTISEGHEAHDAADAGNPIKIGGKGSAAVAAAVTEGDRVNASFTLEGRLRTTGEGAVAHDAADAGNPIKVGFKAITTLPTALTANDRTDGISDLYGRQRVVVSQVAESWSIRHSPAANAAATISKAAGSAAERHVCKGFMVTLSNNGAAASAEVAFQVRDGATGAGTILWEGNLAVPAVAFTQANVVTMSGLYLVGSAATAMTIEFTAAAGANTLEKVNLFGETIPA